MSPCTRTAIGYCPEITCGAVAIALPSSSNHSRAKSSKRPMTAATRSFSRERALPAHSSTSVVIPGEIEDLAYDAVVLAGGDDDGTQALALT